MIPYDFDASFWNPIARGTKIKTLRNMRTKARRHARVDEPIECWAVVDNRRLQIIRAKCVNVEGVYLHLALDQIRVGPIYQHRDTWAPLKKKARELLAIETGHAGGWKEAALAYSDRRGENPWCGTIITWAPRDYDGPIPTHQQLRDLVILSQHARVIPCYGKISPTVAHSLLILKWAEVCDRTEQFRPHDRRGTVPIRITDLGRWILERFEK